MVSLPVGRISGRTLKTLVAAVTRTPLGRASTRLIRAELGVDALTALGAELRDEIAFDWEPVAARREHGRPSQDLGEPRYDGWPTTILDLVDAYRDARRAPGEVVEQSIRAARDFAARTPPLGPLLAYDEEGAYRAASAASERYREGEPLSELDGVPVAIKEEVHVAGLPTRVGTSFLPHTPATADCVAVARLRAAGAVIIGQTPMTEFGMSPLGGNVHRTMPRNPHDPRRLPGGSSSGSGVAVAEGVVPVALGLDGGGSVRIPACLNGVFGLKPTFGRIPASGHGNPTGSSVIHIGPLGGSTADLAIFTEIAAGPDRSDPASTRQPEWAAGELVDALGRGVRDLLIGVDESEWGEADSDVASRGRAALAALEKEGAKLVPVTVPLAKESTAMGYLTIGLEMYAGLLDARRHHFDELGDDMKLLLTQMGGFEPGDYLDAQRLRTTLRRQLAKVLGAVDVLALPTTKTAAPPVTDDEADHGFVDPKALDAMCRYAFLGNLTGVPAGTAPVGTNTTGLPVGLQIVGDAWDEACVLQVMAHLERMGIARSPRPAPHVDLLHP